MPDDYPPLYCGTMAIRLGARVIVDDPRQAGRLGGAGIVRAIEVNAGRIWRVDVELGPNLVAHVPPEWIREDPAAAPNVLPFRRAPRIEEWPRNLFRNVRAHEPEGAA